MGLFGKPEPYKLAAKDNVAGLMKALRYRNDAEVRRDAARCLGPLARRTSADKIRTALLDALNDPDPGVRAAAAGELVHTPSAKVVDSLMAIVSGRQAEINPPSPLGSRDGRLLGEAADALAGIGDVRAVSALLPLLADPDYANASCYGEPLVTRVALALRRFDDPAALEGYSSVMQAMESSARRHPSMSVAGLNAASQIERLRHKEREDFARYSNATLSRLAQSRDPLVRKECARMLRSHGLDISVENARLFVVLAEDADKEVRTEAEEMLVEILKLIRNAQILGDAARSRNETVRAIATQRVDKLAEEDAESAERRAEQEERRRREAAWPDHLKALNEALSGYDISAFERSIVLAMRHHSVLEPEFVKRLVGRFKSAAYKSNNQAFENYKAWFMLRGDAERLIERLAETPRYHETLRDAARDARQLGEGYDPWQAMDNAYELARMQSEFETAKLIERLLPAKEESI